MVIIILGWAGRFQSCSYTRRFTIVSSAADTRHLTQHGGNVLCQWTLLALLVS
ncbi:hypothetical protein CV_3033 [Chromobacterium violaceum ATCC 12472]|uniref:Uncharacterized protein n=1 Tax=Chromobacterium violaceum (strain ATCC 12472 / DSM 30191 / JCM 1249 / CCUG 213 / NBRC 12614 / NCIMB 9131 / NCTC 9757 / MK) TaxID=243365 RepID=Q7NTM1_CHRVO|nr:hypothetical protein CV_3033 [Chromobacterium violaceum ATCC 12472]